MMYFGNMKLANFYGKAIFSANLLIVVSLLPLAAMSAASANNSLDSDSFAFPEGRVVQRTIHNYQEFESLKNRSSRYQIIRNSNLMTFGSRLELLSSENITNAAVWTIANDGIPVGITNCTGLAFGIDECKSITNLVTGIPFFTVARDEHIDPHELLVDPEGNFWYLSYPKITCQDSNEVCQKFKVSKEKVFADCQVNQVNASGRTIFSWNASAHIPPENIINSYIPEGPRQKYMDLFHCNSIDLVDSDNFLISVRNNNAIYQVNKKTSSITWKLGGRYWPNVSLRGVGFDRQVGKETIAQHDARYLGNGLYSYFDNASHTDKPARGVVFSVTQKGNKWIARMQTDFVNPYGNNSLCTGSFTKVSQETYVIGWGCSLNGITIFNSKGNPIVSLNFIKTDETRNLFSDQPWILNGDDWGPRTNRAFSYRVLARR
jgi:hypothetical protein